MVFWVAGGSISTFLPTRRLWAHYGQMKDIENTLNVNNNVVTRPSEAT